MEAYKIYNDINRRTNGEIYLGVVGPVRTGKSTFIKNFAKLMILPKLTDKSIIDETTDELPQSGDGRNIMTTEPKFVPRKACELTLFDDCKVKMRLVDCVGFLIDNIKITDEEGKERYVTTPWYEYNVPFSEAAEFGTRKVIKDHSTVGIVITTDGTITDIDRKDYLGAEEKAITELLNIGKPFIVIVNTKYPSSKSANETVNYIYNKYNVTAIPLNVEEMGEQDVNRIMEECLKMFPVSGFEIRYNEWIDSLTEVKDIKCELLEYAGYINNTITKIKDINKATEFESKFISSFEIDPISFSDGIIHVKAIVDRKYIYSCISNISGKEINDDGDIINLIEDYSNTSTKVDSFLSSIEEVKERGYSVVKPAKEEISISEPEVIRNGTKYGVKIKTESPSYHLIKVNITTEIAPIVGSEAQAKDLKNYIDSKMQNGNTWETQIFGKTVEELVLDGIGSKLLMINDECKGKLSDTMQKVVNETSGGLVCLII